MKSFTLEFEEGTAKKSITWTRGEPNIEYCSKTPDGEFKFSIPVESTHCSSFLDELEKMIDNVEADLD